MGIFGFHQWSSFLFSLTLRFYCLSAQSFLLTANVKWLWSVLHQTEKCLTSVPHPTWQLGLQLPDLIVSSKKLGWQVVPGAAAVRCLQKDKQQLEPSSEKTLKDRHFKTATIWVTNKTKNVKYKVHLETLPQHIFKHLSKKNVFNLILLTYSSLETHHVMSKWRHRNITSSFPI